MPDKPSGSVKAFKFPGKRSPSVSSPQESFVAEEEEPTGGQVQGIPIGSKEEWRVALALEKHGVQFAYQQSIYGGRALRGGQVVDFILYLPYAQPLQVFGNYWHRNEMSQRDSFNLERIRQVFRRECWVLWAEQLQTQAQADEAIASLL